MTSEDAMNIFYLKQEVMSLKLSIRFGKGSSSSEAADYMKAIEYNGMPHSPNRSREAPYEREAIRQADYELKRIARIEKKIADRMKTIELLSEELEQFLATINSPKTRTIIRLRCDGFSWEKIGEMLHIDRRTASRKFYKAFGEKTNKK